MPNHLSLLLSWALLCSCASACTVTLNASQSLDAIGALSNAHCGEGALVLCFGPGNFTGTSNGPYDLSCNGTRLSVVLTGAGRESTFLWLNDSFLQMNSPSTIAVTLTNMTVEQASSAVLIDVTSIASINLTRATFTGSGSGTFLHAYEVDAVSIVDSNFEHCTGADVTLDLWGTTVSMENSVVRGASDAFLALDFGAMTIYNSLVTECVCATICRVITLRDGSMYVEGSYLANNTNTKALQVTRSVLELVSTVVAHNVDTTAVRVIASTANVTDSVICGNNGELKEVGCDDESSGSLCYYSTTSTACAADCDRVGFCPYVAEVFYPVLAAFPDCDSVCSSNIDECSLNLYTCDDNAYCNNTAAGYDCVCSPGYWGSGTAGDCTAEFDECATGTHSCSPTANCTDTSSTYVCTCPFATAGDPYNSDVDCRDACETGEFTSFFAAGECDVCLSPEHDGSFGDIQTALDSVSAGGTVCLGAGTFYSSGTTSTIVRLGSKILRGLTRELTKLMQDEPESVISDNEDVDGFGVSDMTIETSRGGGNYACIRLRNVENGNVTVERVLFRPVNSNAVDAKEVSGMRLTEVELEQVDPSDGRGFLFDTVDRTVIDGLVVKTVDVQESIVYVQLESWNQLAISRMVVSGSDAPLAAIRVSGESYGWTDSAAATIDELLCEENVKACLSVFKLRDQQLRLSNTIDAYCGYLYPLKTVQSEIAVDGGVVVCGDADADVTCTGDSGADNELCDEVRAYETCSEGCSATGWCVSPYLARHAVSDVMSECGLCTYACGDFGGDCGEYAVCEGSNSTFNGSCACITGYGGDPLSSCGDIDECSVYGSNPCGGFNCTNTVGSFVCGADLDECASPNATTLCSVGSACVNTAGSFVCSDVDECSFGLHDCDGNATCTNTHGSYSCSCNTGYWGTGVVGNCTAEVDECSTETHTCSPAATCTDTSSSYLCTCPLGTVGDPHNSDNDCHDACETGEFTAFFAAGDGDICLSGQCDGSFDDVQTALDSVDTGGTVCLGAGTFYSSTTTETITRLGTKTLRGLTRELTKLMQNERASVISDGEDDDGFVVSDISIETSQGGSSYACILLRRVTDGAAEVERVLFRPINSYAVDARGMGDVKLADVELEAVGSAAMRGFSFALVDSVEIDGLVIQPVVSVASLVYVSPETDGSVDISRVAISGADPPKSAIEVYGGFTSSAVVTIDTVLCELNQQSCIQLFFSRNQQIRLSGTVDAYSLASVSLRTSNSEVAVDGGVVVCGDNTTGIVCEDDSGPDNELCGEVDAYTSCSEGCSATGSCVSPYLARYAVTDVVAECGVCTYACGDSGSNCGEYAVCEGITSKSNGNCACITGYGGDPLSGCDDVDECSVYGSNPCGGFNCTNTVGSFMCGAELDECASATACPGHYNCTDTFGSFMCSGDVDECSFGLHDCDSNAYCANVDGGYNCSCAAGYWGSGVAGDCTAEVDECTTGTHGCSPAANCTDTTSSYFCTCPFGTAGDPYNSNIDCRDACVTGEFTSFFAVGECDVCLSGQYDGSFDDIQKALDSVATGGTVCLGAGTFYSSGTTNRIVRLGTKTVRGLTRELTKLMQNELATVFSDAEDVDGFTISDMTIETASGGSTYACVRLRNVENGAVAVERVRFRPILSHAVDARWMSSVTLTDVELEGVGTENVRGFYFLRVDETIVDGLVVADVTSQNAVVSTTLASNDRLTVSRVAVAGSQTGTAVLWVDGLATGSMATTIDEVLCEQNNRRCLHVNSMPDQQVRLSRMVDAYTKYGEALWSDESEVAVDGGVVVCGDNTTGIVCEDDSGPDNELCGEVDAYTSCSEGCSATGSCVSPYLARYAVSDVVSECGVCTYACGDGGGDCGEYAVCGNSGSSSNGSCACITGYGGDPLSGCADVDECVAYGSNPCGGFNCTNTIGSFVCGADVDECTVYGSNPCGGFVCTNTVGSFVCGADMDECASANSTTTLCPGYDNCTNTFGSFVCSDDVDECSLGLHDCGSNATCGNVDGSYSCSCVDGFVGDGRNCSAVSVTESATPTTAVTSTETTLDGSSTTGGSVSATATASTVTADETSSTASSAVDTTTVSNTSTPTTTTATSISPTTTSTAGTEATASTTTVPSTSEPATTTLSDDTDSDDDGGGDGDGQISGSSPSGGLSTGAIVGISIPAGLLLIAVPVVAVAVYAVGRTKSEDVHPTAYKSSEVTSSRDGSADDSVSDEVSQRRTPDQPTRSNASLSDDDDVSENTS